MSAPKPDDLNSSTCSLTIFTFAPTVSFSVTLFDALSRNAMFF